MPVKLKCAKGAGPCGPLSATDAPITHVDEKGFVYCAFHGGRRKQSGVNCRKLKRWEIAKLERGETIGYSTPHDVPACVASMGTLCAGHARGNPAGDPCNTDEAPAAVPPIEVDDHDCRANGCTFPRECEGARSELRMLGFKLRMPPMPQQAPSTSALLDVIAGLLPYAESRAEDMTESANEGDPDDQAEAKELAAKAWVAVELARMTLTAAGRKP